MIISLKFQLCPGFALSGVELDDQKVFPGQGLAAEGHLGLPDREGASPGWKTPKSRPGSTSLAMLYRLASGIPPATFYFFS